jgi:hypothetical protein
VIGAATGPSRASSRATTAANVASAPRRCRGRSLAGGAVRLLHGPAGSAAAVASRQHWRAGSCDRVTTSCSACPATLPSRRTAPTSTRAFYSVLDSVALVLNEYDHDADCMRARSCRSFRVHLMRQNRRLPTLYTPSLPTGICVFGSVMRTPILAHGTLLDESTCIGGPFDRSGLRQNVHDSQHRRSCT